MYRQTVGDFMSVPQQNAARNPKLRTACDRCYELKEKCQRSTSSGPCSRCDRLSLTCSTIRPAKPCGRRMQHGKKDHVSIKNTANRGKIKINQSITKRYLDAFIDLQPEEKELVKLFFNQSESMNHLALYSSSQAEQQQSIATQLPDIYPSLKDAYLACAMTIQHLNSGPSATKDTSTCIKYISKAMSTLRSLPVLTSKDAVLCNTLGGILAFSVYSAIGVGVPEICAFCLSTTSVFVEPTGLEAQNDPWQSFLVLLETADCLVYRRKPTRSPRLPTSTFDRRLGLSVPLLAYYHELAVISNSLVTAIDSGILSRLQKQLDNIHASLESWQPSSPGQVLDQFNSRDIVNLLAQAKVYRLGALLVAHRLQHPFGCKDSQAETWSKEAMMELEMARLVTKSPLRFVTLPFIVAAVEIRDENMRSKTLQHVDDYVDYYAPFLRKGTKKFLSRVWHERDAKLTTRWFDSIHKPCPVMESLDSASFDNPRAQSNIYQSSEVEIY